MIKLILRFSRIKVEICHSKIFFDKPYLIKNVFAYSFYNIQYVNLNVKPFGATNISDYLKTNGAFFLLNQSSLENLYRKIRFRSI